MILIVDDHKDNAELLQRLLRAKGYQADCAHNGTEALTYLQSKRVGTELVILDDMMPDQSGLDLLRVVRADPTLAEIPVLFFSASFEPARLQQARELGARGWLVKGSDTWETLIGQISAVLTPDLPPY
jgi:CheY-like chemotaxis protein